MTQFWGQSKEKYWGYELSQTQYIEKMIDKFKYIRFKEVITPYNSSVKLQNNDGRVVAQLEYAVACNVLDSA